MPFVRFMSGAAGRSLRIVAGIALVVAGWSLHSAAGIALEVVGVVVFAAGALNVCLFAPFFGAPLRP